jgi:hypothetical protein
MAFRAQQFGNHLHHGDFVIYDQHFGHAATLKRNGFAGKILRKIPDANPGIIRRAFAPLGALPGAQLASKLRGGEVMKKTLLLIGGICAGLGSGCSSAPGTPGQQGAVVGGATGAAVGASVTHNRALGAVIGGAVGAAGGYVVGNKTGPLDKHGEQTTTVTNPDGTVQTTTVATADLNHDGFVTLDEVVSMHNSGVSDEEMVRRMQATGLTFDLNEDQRKYLSDHGVSGNVINQLPSLNRTYTTVPAPTTYPSSGTSVISK